MAENQLIRVAVDAMGGDNAPSAPIKGAIDALNENPRISLLFMGDEQQIQEELKTLQYDSTRVSVVHCTQKIEMAEPPAAAIQKKKDSSIVKGMMAVRKGEADAFVSAGSTGAVLVGGQVLVGRVKGVERPPLAALIPTEKGVSLLIDCGANVDPRPTWLLQFAEMGSIYLEHALGIKNPTVGILNIGAEEEKGNALVKETFPLLKACKEINFIGSVEARDIPGGAADVIVTDAFSGNVLMKMYEGTASTIYHIAKKGLMSSIPGMLGGLLAKGTLKKVLKDFDASKYGGAPLLGLKGLVVKAHGSSKPVEFRIAVNQCETFYRENVNGKIRERMESEALKIRELKKKQAPSAAAAAEKTE
ncbi:MAG: phosphate acyltransferase PlsX [Lachnospiraceae bacterium]|nr:phosphate acyltransferase PlsX [Lachnospiraceae bacterium]